ncbi:hypothetical protein BABINDRAFT_166282 [Babjeviella inositovora NRRL Y-12698]|uniref:DASH complex subunit ASK1 n=1 Tax=Babjeviella inositovora NRRL Y-12698 TaxID=984486 RepID=A0A1E3QUK3_9ASCO|nr:uncharacterized protein BABINDRAFT_166282 [Babjeviella inositovora NRRL Y-12698]ODQ80682.1 hypothetical protein BABINDRAFT_166282 [Babjeviella inositovora NRRL Y-12698]
MQRQSIVPNRTSGKPLLSGKDEPPAIGRRKSVFHTRPVPSFQSGTSNAQPSPATSSTLQLEHLEQEITLTLQEIDKNFSKSNKIINDLILPIIKNYAGSSRNLWSSVQFWKQFFENSANVQLAGYEEAMEPFEREDQDALELRSEVSEHEESESLAQYPGRDPEDISDSTIQQFQKRYSRTADSPKRIQETDFTPQNLNFPGGIEASTPDLQKHVPATTGYVDTTDSILQVPTSNFVAPSSRRSPLKHQILDSTVSGSFTVPTKARATPPRDQTSLEAAHQAKVLSQSPFIEDPTVPTTMVFHQSGAGNQYKIRMTPSPSKRLLPSAKFSSPRRSPERKSRSERRSITAQFDSSPEISPPRLMSDVQLSPDDGKRTHGLSPEKPLRGEKKPRQEIRRFPDTPKYNSENGTDFNKTPRGIEMRYADSTTMDEANITNNAMNRGTILPRMLTNRQRQKDANLDHQLDELEIQSDGDDLPEGISPPVTIQFAKAVFPEGSSLRDSSLGSKKTKETAADIIREILQEGSTSIESEPSLVNVVGEAESVETAKANETEFHSFDESDSVFKPVEGTTEMEELVQQAEQLEPIAVTALTQGVTDIDMSGFEFDAFLDQPNAETTSGHWSDE